MRVSRINGSSTLAKRRCCEFRQLAKDLRTEFPKNVLPELPAKKSYSFLIREPPLLGNRERRSTWNSGRKRCKRSWSRW